MKQVLLREQMLNGDKKLVRVEVLADQGEMLRVKHPNKIHPIEVKASDTMPVEKVFGFGKPGQATTVLPKAYPSSPHALANRI